MDRWAMKMAVFGVALGATGGCAPQLRTLPGEGVVLTDDGKAAVAERAGVSVFARGADVPWSRRGDPTGVFLEITNGRPTNVTLDLEQVVLIDSAEHRRTPESPVQMIEAFQTAADDQRPLRVGVSVSYGYGPRYGPYPFYRSYPYHYDPWYDQDTYERTERAKFLSRLLTSRSIEPAQVVSGYVVFPFRMRRDDTIGLEVTLTARQPTSSPVESIPAAAEQGAIRFVFDFIVK